MNSKSEYVPADLEKSGETKHKGRFKKGILKSNRYKNVGKIHLTPLQADENNEIEYFQPVYHGDQVIGIIHKCTCERVSEIHFEYDSEIKKGTNPQLPGNESA